MGTDDARDLPVGRLAPQSTLTGHLSHAPFGGSLLSPFWRARACTLAGADAPLQYLKDERYFMPALRDRTLPSVSFVKPIVADSGHPKYGDVRRGEDHVAALVKAVQDTEYWKDTVIVLTYDENGGFWDHVGPPTIDRWGPGTRVPTIVVSPVAKKGDVDHTRYDTTSIPRR